MPLRDDDFERRFPEEENENSPMKKILGGIGIALVCVVIAGAGFYYLNPASVPDPQNLPVITEDQPMEKIKPADAGGMDIPHQDAAIYDRIATQNPVPDAPEKLLPPPEEPMAPDAANTVTEPVPAQIPTDLSATASGQPEGAPPVDVLAEAGIKPVVSAEAKPAEAKPAETKSPEPKAEAKTAETKPAEAKPVETKQAETKKEEPKQTLQDIVKEEASKQAANPPAAAAQPAATQGTGNFRIQLGAVRDENLAKAEWARLTARHGEALKGLEPFYAPVNLGEKGKYLRIQTTTVSREDAEARCTKLKANNQACLIIKAAQ